jgi:hypothetical protein
MRRHTPPTSKTGPLAILAGTVLLALLAAAVLVFASDGGRGGTPGPVALVGGVPVGVQDTPAGALAAADNYVALASQSIEQNPTLFAELVAQAYAPTVRAHTLAEAQTIRGGDPQNIANYREGGRGIAVIAARRLDSYTAREATVTSWLGGFVWGPRLTPRQTWNLIDTRLRWQQGRWLVTSSSTDQTPAPVPSIVYIDGANDQAAAFARLAGMSAPYYGTGG